MDEEQMVYLHISIHSIGMDKANALVTKLLQEIGTVSGVTIYYDQPVQNEMDSDERPSASELMEEVDFDGR